MLFTNGINVLLKYLFLLFINCHLSFVICKNKLIHKKTDTVL